MPDTELETCNRAALGQAARFTGLYDDARP